MSTKEKSKDMQALAEAWRASGKSQICYAREHNISIHKLKYWLYKKRTTKKPSGGFIQIGEIASEQGYLIRYPNGVEIKLPLYTSPAFIGRLIKL